MSDQLDDDILFHKASANLVADLSKILNVLLWNSSGAVHHVARTRDLDKAVSLIEPFQEEPQLLDPHLKSLVPPLIEAFLLHLSYAAKAPRFGTCSLSYAICKVLYTLCKVRGQKVIIGFFNHDPPNLERILHAYEEGLKSNATQLSWEERYILVLWLWHLMLIPFDLRTLSDNIPLERAGQNDTLVVPSTLPATARRVLPICVQSLSSATKECDTATKLLVRLSLRGDVRDHGLLEAIIPWALGRLRSETSDPSSLHQALGLLSFLSNFTASAAPEVASPFLHPIYSISQAILAKDVNPNLGSSAVARKLLIKIFRNIVLLCLQSPETVTSMDPNDVLSEVIESLLTMVGDSDTPVRYAASKALSAITLKLDPAMAIEVIEAILASLQEDLITDHGGHRNTSAVNALRWHGLTLALAQLLYKRAPPTDQLGDIFSALILSLEFSQRSAAGVAIGTNVRDGACFGIWALSRRYTTQELLAVDPALVQISSDRNKAPMSVLVLLATRLLAAACFDPSGNIRRGASAALQELIGRNPDVIPEGISLVQIVDYQAVGLRKRAMIDVAVRAATLSNLYWQALFDAIQGDRGMFAVDEMSRGYAATGLGRLVRQREARTSLQTIQRLQSTYSVRKSQMSVQDRHGLILALSSVLDQAWDAHQASHKNAGTQGEDNFEEVHSPLGLIQSLDVETWLDYPDKDFLSATRNPQLTATAVCKLVSSLGSILHSASRDWQPAQFTAIVKNSQRLLNLCLQRTEAEIIEVIPQCVSSMLTISTNRQELIKSWLDWSAVNGTSISKNTAHVIALGAALPTCTLNADLADAILNVLAIRCTSVVGITARMLAVRAMGLAMSSWLKGHDPATPPGPRELGICANALQAALNDYTITERGDVGSLVRLEALSTLSKLYQDGWDWDVDGEISRLIKQDIVRLSLERLDKVRATACECIAAMGGTYPSVDNTSSSMWFSHWLEVLHDADAAYLRRAVLQGCCSSAGMGAENVVHAARSSLLLFLNQLLVIAEDSDIFTLLSFADLFKEILRDNLKDEYALLPLLEVLAFLLDMRVLQRLVESPFDWRGLLILVQKSHYQSKSIPKILLALNIYRGLADVPKLEEHVEKKLKDMKKNPMAPVKLAAEETLFVLE